MEKMGIWGIILLGLDIWAIINIAQSNADTAKKALWVLLVVLLPLVGLIIWYFTGPKASKA